MNQKTKLYMNHHHIILKYHLSKNTAGINLLLNKLRNIVSDQLIYVISHSHFLYGILFWGYSTEFVFKRQKRAITGMQGLNLKDNFRTLQILTVPCIYTFICFVYVKENLVDSSLRKPIHANRTRNTNK